MEVGSTAKDQTFRLVGIGTIFFNLGHLIEKGLGRPKPMCIM